KLFSRSPRPMRLRAAPRRCPALWRSLRCPRDELRWGASSPGCWTGVLAGRVWTLTQDEERLWYTVYGEEDDGDPPAPLGAHTDAILRDYFQLDVGLRALYRAWGAADPHFQAVAAAFPGEPRGSGRVRTGRVRAGGPGSAAAQACGCCGRSPSSACSPSSAPPTTTWRAWPP
uniref:8-oxoguanine DNA glycosylase N-terminal domain-containing protein n=1 Tax=Nothoprocta perdicaria TaxID=30464 RepID=A0A8C6Z3M0_NOTPE